ncbi:MULTISPECIES: anti-sigma factor [Actinomadura]|uniref:Zinc-finger domain-containing protein n=1 Tax=Actinomadura litoris TaxID=2678616 RepID=A0A7K1L0S0_9ACTN|nr:MULTISPECIES: hypothetical protein [Actinomadura]MBT2206996.1 hypothetical protein [Actinomadura sp. NEAU-AAG7]MUN37903.1 hypothetical protein [Actinomadura litoris]
MNPAHLDYDVLADLAEGLLEDDQAASVNAHLDTCAECRELSADLADVSRILAEAPVPSMPAELAERIDSAIAAESLNNATVVSMEQRRGRRHWRILSAAAATVVVLGGGAVVSKIALDGSSGDDHRSVARSPVQDATRPQGSAPGAARQSPSGQTMLNAPSYVVARSGTDYTTGDLGRQVDRLVGKQERTKQYGDPPDQRLVGCVNGVTSGKAPALVDRATFEGKQATVIAIRGDKPGNWNIWVVGPDCTAQNPHILKHEPA